MKRVLLLIVAFMIAGVGFVEAKTKNALPIPRFVSTKSNKVHSRTGPNVRYPIKWVYVQKGEPLEVIAEFEQWRKVRDRSGEEGWVHETMLSSKRTAIVLGKKPQIVYQKPSYSSKAIVQLEPGVRVNFNSCKRDWCKISLNSYQGWVERKNIWGVNTTAKIDNN